MATYIAPYREWRLSIRVNLFVKPQTIYVHHVTAAVDMLKIKNLDALANGVITLAKKYEGIEYIYIYGPRGYMSKWTKQIQKAWKKEFGDTRPMIEVDFNGKDETYSNGTLD